MTPSAPRSFGKRNASAPRPLARGPHAAPDHAVFFAEARRAIETDDRRPVVVPRSYRAAFLAGLIVGFCTIGLDLGQAAPVLDSLARTLGADQDLDRLRPVMIVASLLGSARLAAMTVVIAHRILAAQGQTAYPAYALGGAAMAGAYAGLSAGLGQPPGHGFAIEILAGAGVGLFYRLFAGARRG